ncbi:MAG: hypothetical protein F4099_00990 [Synechococcus sp. SB0673_bin_10]|nr:hypothetical protein [Synechococcus sp. SB0673_bin_10]
MTELNSATAPAARAATRETMTVTTTIGSDQRRHHGVAAVGTAPGEGAAMDGDCSLGLEAGGLEVIGLSMGHGLQSHGSPRLGVASPTLPRRAREPGLLDDGLTRWKEGPG